MWMWNPIVLSVAILMDISDVKALPSFLFQDGDHYETAVVSHERTGRARTSREATSLPSILHFRFDLNNQPIKLRLKRNVNDWNELPVFTLNHGARVRKNIVYNRTSGFYHDLHHGAAVMVTHNHNDPSRPFDLEGSVFIDGREYLMTPSHRLLPVNGHDHYSTDMMHTFKRLNTLLNYGQDWIDERGPFARIKARQQEIQRRLHRLGQGHNPWPDSRFFPPFANKGSRWKRQTSEVKDTHYIEVSMVADFAVWERFLAYADGDENLAFKELQHYYTFIATVMDVRYQSVTKIDPTLRIRIHPVSIIVTDIREEAIWTERNRLGRSYVNAISSLYALRNWVRNRVGVPEADHTMLFTGYDIMGGNRDSSTIGVAFIGTACTDNSVSLIEEYFTGTSGAVSAHELGHSLDAEHDGSYRRCSDYTANIMSTQAIFPSDDKSLSNPWMFSSCSVDAFGVFLETSSCTRNKPKDEIIGSWGRSFNADEQCRLAMGDGSYFCRSAQSRKGFPSMCRRLYCYLPDEPGYCGSIIAGEFTVCGNKKWCNQGRCVEHHEAPIVPDDCPQGDEPGERCQPNPSCDEPKVRDKLCCKACRTKDNSSQASETGDKLSISTTSLTPSTSQTSPGSLSPTTSSSTSSSISLITSSSTSSSISSTTSSSTSSSSSISSTSSSSISSTKEAVTKTSDKTRTTSKSPDDELTSARFDQSSSAAPFTSAATPSPSIDTTVPPTQMEKNKPSTTTATAPAKTATMEFRSTAFPIQTKTEVISNKSPGGVTTKPTLDSMGMETTATTSSFSAAPSSSSLSFILSSLSTPQYHHSSLSPSALTPSSFSSPPSSSKPLQQSPSLSTTTSETTTPTPATTTTPTMTTVTTTTTTPTKPPPVYIPCNNIQCLCSRCFTCFYNACYLFIPGGIYYNPNA